MKGRQFSVGENEYIPAPCCFRILSRTLFCLHWHEDNARCWHGELVGDCFNSLEASREVYHMAEQCGIVDKILYCLC